MKLKAYEIRQMSGIERAKKLEDLKKELFREISSNAMGRTSSDPSRIKQLKKSIARLITIMKEYDEL